MKMRYAPACWSTWRAWGVCNMNVCVVVFESTLSPHKHVLTLGLPAFLQCRTYLVSRETTVFLVMWGTWMSAVVGQFSWLGCAGTQVHMSARLLFTYVCMRHDPTRSWSTGSTNFLRTHDPCKLLVSQVHSTQLLECTCAFVQTQLKRVYV
jgi:hypothetical protein